MTPAETTSPDPTAADLAWMPLDPRVVPLWRVSHLIGSAVLFLFALVPGIVIGRYLVPPSWPWIVGFWLLLAALRIYLYLWHPARSYQGWGYRIDDKVLEIRHGIWFTVLQLLPLSRVQHVDIQRGPLERRYGLASLVLHTAGTHAANLVIPGLDADEAIRLRDRLLAVAESDSDDAV